MFFRRMYGGGVTSRGKGYVKGVRRHEEARMILLFCVIISVTIVLFVAKTKPLDLTVIVTDNGDRYNSSTGPTVVIYSDVFCWSR